MSRVVRTLALVVLLLSMTDVFARSDSAAEASPSKWQVRAQGVGYQGLLSIGGGPVLFKGVWRPGLMYGWAPGTDQRSTVHTIILRNDIVLPFQWRKAAWSLAPTVSANLLFDTGGHSFLFLPDKYPDGYYRTTAVHATVGLGGRIGHAFQGSSFPREMGLSVELVTLDTYAYWALTQREIPFSDAVSLAFAVDVMF